MSDQTAAAGPDGTSPDTLESSGLREDEARLYSALAVARLETSTDGVAELGLTHDELAVLMAALETLEAMRRGVAGHVAGLPELSPDEVAHLTLDDAAETTRLAVIATAVGGNLLEVGQADTLDALTAALERLRRLGDAAPRSTARAVELELLADHVDALLNAILVAGVTREHLTGRLDALREPLEALDHAHRRLGATA